MILYVCRSCGLYVLGPIRPHLCHGCWQLYEFEEVWTEADQRFVQFIERWNQQEVVTGKVKFDR